MKKTPEEWSAEKGIRIIDPDGWRNKGDFTWNEPIDEKEFMFLAMMSTCDWSEWKRHNSI
jgi:hypothetical protein